MTERLTRREAWSFFQGVLTNLVSVEKGEMAVIDTLTGLVTKGAVSTTLRPIGYFDETLVGDGVADVRVRLFDELMLHWFDNDTAGTPVVAADIGDLAFILDERTVSGDSTGRSAAGRVWALSTLDGVLLDMIDQDIADVVGLSSGEYTPTLFDVTNVDASVVLAARFIRVGNQVTVYFAVTIDATAAAATELGISLPVVSVLAAVNDLGGIAGNSEAVAALGQVAGDVANDRASLTFVAIGTGVLTWRGSFSYNVL